MPGTPIPVNISATKQVDADSGVLMGIFCSSTTSGTVTIYDGNATANTKIVGVFNLTAGQFYPIQCAYMSGLYVVVGGTASITVIYASLL